MSYISGRRYQVSIETKDDDSNLINLLVGSLFIVFGICLLVESLTPKQKSARDLTSLRDSHFQQDVKPPQLPHLLETSVRVFKAEDKT